MAKSSNNVLALGVGLNLDPLKDDITAAAAAAKAGMGNIAQSVVDGGQKAGAATKDLGDKVQSMRAQLRQATQDTQQMAEKYGVMSAQAIASASRAGELKDKIGDINTVITAFSADSKFTVVAGALQQAAGAASIVTGAMGLMGVKSEETAAMLLKVQSALALTQGLAQLKEMGAAFTALQAVIVGQVIPSIMAMGTATIVATGGLILVIGLAVAAIVSYNNTLDAETQAHLDAAAAAKKQAESESNLTKIVQETNALRTAALKDGIVKDKQLLADKTNDELNNQWNAYQKGEVAAFTYNERVKYIKQAAFNELQKIDENYKKLNEAKVKAENKKTLSELKVQYAEIAQIQSQFQGGGQMNLGSFSAPTMPTKTGLNEKETMAFKINQETSKAKDALMNAQVQMQEAAQKFNESFASTLNQGMAKTLGGLGQIIGDTIAGNITDPFAALGDMLLQSIGGVMVQLGTQMIALGVGMAALDLGIKTLNPFVAIAGGIALVAAGTAISAIASKGSKGGTSSSGGSGGSNNSSFSGNNSAYSSNMSNKLIPNLEISGKLNGRDIMLGNKINERGSGRSLEIGG